jgi:hypothetical protein
VNSATETLALRVESACRAFFYLAPGVAQIDEFHKVHSIRLLYNNSDGLHVVGCGAHHGIKFAAQSSLSAEFNNQSSSCSEFPPLPVYGIALLF